MKKKIFSLVVALMAIALGAQAASKNGHEYVDLGLPSGILWATMNIGASTPEEAGDRFAWGETVAKSEFTDENYNPIYNERDWFALQISDDAAHANWGGSWRMPTKEEFKELIDNCTRATNGAGVTFTSKINGKSIFFPNNYIIQGYDTKDYSICAIWTSTNIQSIYVWSYLSYYDDLLYSHDGITNGLIESDKHDGFGVRAIYDSRTHEHVFSESDKYYDENYHYNACVSTTGVCDGSKKNVEAHTFNSQNVCTVCQYEKGTKHIHSYATNWSKDEGYHWHACTSTVGTCNAPKANYAAHTFGADNTCTVCGYSKGATTKTISNIPSGWKVNGQTPTSGSVSVKVGDAVTVTPANIPSGKKIKSIKAVKKQ